MKKGTGWKLGTIGLAGSLTMVTATLAGVGGIALNVLPVKPKDLKSEQIDYVALGDSFTSGYNAFMGEDYVSFADFFAADLKRADRLGSYKNFSKKSNLIFDVMNQAVLAGDVREALLNADVITITAGANDLVHLLEIAGMALPSLHKSHEYGEVIDEDINNGYPNGYDQKISDAVMDLAHKIATQDFEGMMNIDETIYKDLYLAVTLNLTLLTTEIAKLAPGAQIILLSPMDPLPYMPESMMNSPMPGNNGMSFNDVYAKLMDTYDNIAKLNPAVKHINMGEISEYKNDTQKVTIDGMIVDRKHPHIGDVNPSVYGHELIGNGLFRMMSPQLGIKYDDNNLAHGHKAVFDENEKQPIFNSDGTPIMGTGLFASKPATKNIDIPNDVDQPLIGVHPGQYQILTELDDKMASVGLTQKLDANGEPLFYYHPGDVRFSAGTGNVNLVETPSSVTPVNLDDVPAASSQDTWLNSEEKNYWPYLVKNTSGGIGHAYKWSASYTGQFLTDAGDTIQDFSPEYTDELAQDIYINDTTQVYNSKGISTTVSDIADDLTSTFMFDVVKDLINTTTTKTDITSFLASGMPKIINQIRNAGSDDQYFAVNTFLNSTANSAGVNIPTHKVFSMIKQGKEIKPFDIDITEITDSFIKDGAAADLMAILQLMLASATPEEFTQINNLVDSLILNQTQKDEIEAALSANPNAMFRGSDTHIGTLDVTTINNAKNIFDLNLMMTMSTIRELMEDNNGSVSGFGVVFGTNKAQFTDGLREASPYQFWQTHTFAASQNSITALIQKYGLDRSREIFKDFGVNLTDENGAVIDIDAYFDELLVAFDGNGKPFTLAQDKVATAKMTNPDGTPNTTDYPTVVKMANAMQRNLGSLDNPTGRMYSLLASYDPTPAP